MSTWPKISQNDRSKESLSRMPSSQNIDITTSGDTEWWALYTRHQHEKTVADMLSAKGFEVFLPQYESMRRWKDRSKLLSLPLFPCYVFVRGGLHRRLQVVTTPGVHMILYYGENVAIIPDDEIQAIRRTVDGPFRVEPHPFLKCGDRVRVTRGTLEGVEGILIRKKNLCRLVLSVDMLAQSVAVEIDGSDVEPVAPQGLANSTTVVEESAGAGRFREALLHGGGQIAGFTEGPISVG
jgi:transcription antitermination factor NusG